MLALRAAVRQYPGARSRRPGPVCYSPRGRSSLRTAGSHIGLELRGRGKGGAENECGGSGSSQGLASPLTSSAPHSPAPQHHDDCSLDHHGHSLERAQAFSGPAAASLPRSLPSRRCPVESAAICGPVAIGNSLVWHIPVQVHTHICTHALLVLLFPFFFFLHLFENVSVDVKLTELNLTGLGLSLCSTMTSAERLNSLSLHSMTPHCSGQLTVGEPYLRQTTFKRRALAHSFRLVTLWWPFGPM